MANFPVQPANPPPMMPAVAPLKRERRERGSLPRVDEFVFFFIPPFFTPMPHWQEETLCSKRKSERVKIYAVVPFEIPHKEGGQKKSIALKVWS